MQPREMEQSQTQRRIHSYQRKHSTSLKIQPKTLFQNEKVLNIQMKKKKEISRLYRMKKAIILRWQLQTMLCQTLRLRTRWVMIFALVKADKCVILCESQLLNLFSILKKDHHNNIKLKSNQLHMICQDKQLCLLNHLLTTLFSIITQVPTKPDKILTKTTD